MRQNKSTARRKSKKRRKSEGNKMKGDMWDDGSPNPLVVKCPICGCTDIGTMIGSGQVEYHCHNCKHAWFSQKQEITTDGPLQYAPPSASVPSYSITTNPLFTDELANSIGQKYSYGWICPKCGKVYSPDVKECLNCNYLANIKVSGQINQSPSTETHPQDVTATMNAQEKRVRQDGSLVIDKSWFPNLTKDSTVYAGGGGTNWCKATGETGGEV